jgi:lysosomal Pro-X carboxypeptidase
MWENAPLTGAMVIFAEHRYYGTSFPSKATGSDNPYLYLSVEQALADYAYLIEYLIKNKYFPATSPVITFGGSYGGMLASWFRQKYPHLTAGFVINSIQFKSIIDFKTNQ